MADEAVSADNTGLLLEAVNVGDNESLTIGYTSLEDDQCGCTHHVLEKAVLFIREGLDNEKFTSQPSSHRALVAYKLLHHRLFYSLLLLATLCLLLLAIFEQPSKFVEVHSRAQKAPYISVELFLLTFIGFSFVLKLMWLGPKLFFRSRSTALIVILAVMYLEAIAVLASENRHYRFTRALRPLFLLDTYLMSGARRVVRHIFLCLKQIADVMLVLLYLVAIFSLMAYFLFTNNNSIYFGTITKSFVSMLITLTTANHPDVFMESYYESRVTPLFFIVYMLIALYYFSNVLLAVVFANFKDAQRKKFKKLFLHRRDALKNVYDILETKKGEGIKFINFAAFMQVFMPKLADHEIMCMYRALQKSSSVMEEGDMGNIQFLLPSNERNLSLEQFYKLYEVLGMKWELIHDSGMLVSWYEGIEFFEIGIKIILAKLHMLIRHWSFDIIMSCIVLANLVYLFVYINLREDSCIDSIGKDQFCSSRQGLGGSFVFNIIYLTEICLRLFLDGPVRYFKKWSNWFDFFIVVVPFACLCIEAILLVAFNDAGEANKTVQAVAYVAMARPIKLLRLLKLKKNYFYLIRIMVVLVGRMFSVLSLLLILFYVYSIIGMEVFSGPNHRVFPGCCVNATYGVGIYYSNNGTVDSLTNQLDNANVYWLNNFDNIWSSYVTLYEEMVVNNWFIQMEGFVSTTSQFARIYFILFWITTTIVVNTAIVYIVDAFESGFKALNIRSSSKEGHQSSELKVQVFVKVSEHDIENIETIRRAQSSSGIIKQISLNKLRRKWRTIAINRIMHYKGEFRGRRLMKGSDLRKLDYKNDIESWIEEHENNKYTSEPVEDQFYTTKQMLMKGIIYVWKKFVEIIFYILG